MTAKNYGSLTKKEIEDVIEEVKSSGFKGNIFLTFENDEARYFIDKVIETYNTVLNGCIFMKENVAYIELDGENTDYSIIPGYYRLVFTGEFSFIVVGNDAFNIDEVAEKCKSTREDISLDIAPQLEKEAFRIAKAYGIRYNAGKFTIYNTDTMMGRMETALKKGNLRMDIPCDQTSIHTIRAYCGLLRQMHSKPVRCKVNGNNITVYFRNPSASELLKEEIKDRIEQSVNVLSENDIVEIFDLFDIHFTETFQKYMEFMAPSPQIKNEPEKHDDRIDDDFFNNKTEPTPDTFDENDF